MTTELVFLKYLSKVEQNITNDNIATDKGRFIMLFNEAQNKFLEAHLQQRGVDDVRYIQNFLVLDKKIPYSSKSQDHYNFNLPKDYLDIAQARGIASNKLCNNQLISLFEIQTENINEILIDEFNKPSFKWREAPYTVNSNTVSVYVDDFKVDTLLLNYYKYPNQIQQLDSNNPESPFNESILIEWDDKALDRIISLAAGEFDMNENNPRFQVQLGRQQK